jgi:diguanylate cyclase (GGDEF)-like protein
MASWPAASRVRGVFGVRTASARDDRGGRWRFVVRWVAAVAVSMLLGGVLVYVMVSREWVQITLAESTKGYQAQVATLEGRLASSVSAAGRLEVMRDELNHIKATYGVEYAALFDSAGGLVATSAGGRNTEVQVDAQGLRDVISSQRPLVRVEADEGEASDEGRYEFLIPVHSPEGLLLLEVDQRQDIVSNVLANLRLRMALALLVSVLVAVPLSYLLGGHTIYRRQRRAEVSADTDALTGLAGRRPFRPMLEATLSGAGNSTVGLALVDIDDFKQVNDKFGHSHGDRVLVALGEAFTALRSSDTAFRIGGDEFAVVLPGSTDQEAAAVIERVRVSLAALVPGVTFSCGVAADCGVSMQELWERADAALYEAKASGRRQTVTFQGMSTTPAVSPAKLDAVTGLLSEGSGLSVAFQPIWDLRRGRILGHEALLRLPPGLPIDGPEQAFALAHRLGVVVALDERARHEVLDAVRDRQWQGLLFINVHPDALRSLDLDALANQVIAAGLEIEQVVLEVTEHADMDSPGPIRALKQAQARGFRLALDDMGHGNAGLRALTLVRFDVVKIARDVIVKLGTDPASDATVAAATTFVQRAGGWVIAEGIEDHGILTAVCDTERRPPLRWMLAGQGYLLGQPAPVPVPMDTRLDAYTHDWTDPQCFLPPLPSMKSSSPLAVVGGPASTWP